MKNTGREENENRQNESFKIVSKKGRKNGKM